MLYLFIGSNASVCWFVSAFFNYNTPLVIHLKRISQHTWHDACPLFTKGIPPQSITNDSFTVTRCSSSRKPTQACLSVGQISIDAAHHLRKESSKCWGKEKHEVKSFLCRRQHRGSLISSNVAEIPGPTKKNHPCRRQKCEKRSLSKWIIFDKRCLITRGHHIFVGLEKMIERTLWDRGGYHQGLLVVHHH